jgi:hypothetical protein
MTTLSETLTLGLVLVLLFGSICLYLYTRIQQNEQKLNLVESILIDLKMTTEVKSYPDLPAPVSMAAAPTQVTVEMKEMPEADLATGSIVDASDLTGIIDESSSVPVASETIEVIQSIASDESNAETGSVKVGPNYNSMTQTELRALAKQRHISNVSSMRRQQLIEALQTSDRAEEAGAPQLMEPFLATETPSVVSIPA